MKIYVAGKITGDPDYREKFNKAAAKLEAEGHTVLNPAILPDGFEWAEYMKICFAMIRVCEMVVFLPDWKDSEGAVEEMKLAQKLLMQTVILEYKKAV